MTSPDIPGVTPPLPTGTPLTTRQQKINFYASFLAKLPGTYQGNATAFTGQTWSQLYETLAQANPTADPKQLADAVLGFEAAQSTGQNIQGAGNTLGGFIANAQKSIPAGIHNTVGAFSNPLDFLQEIGDFFARLGQANTWIRIAKVVVGGALLLIGLSHITGIDNKAADMARNIKVLPV